jgi:hypothetical protein
MKGLLSISGFATISRIWLNAKQITYYGGCDRRLPGHPAVRRSNRARFVYKKLHTAIEFRPGWRCGRKARIRGAAMNTEIIDEAIDKYVHERLVKGKEKASERFLAYAYLKNGGDEVLEFFKKVGGLSRYYIDFLKVMENPFKGPELAWLATMVVIAVFSCYLMGDADSRMLGVLVFSGTLVHGFSLIRMTAKKWSEAGVMIAIYREIVQIVDRELGNPA